MVLVDLEEGPTMMSNVFGCSVDDVCIGMPVEVMFDDWSEGVTIPEFKPSVA